MNGNFVQVDPTLYNTATITITDNPVGVELDAPFGPEVFDSFKDAQGRYRTQSLFIETPHKSYPAFFTTKKHDVDKNGQTYISLYQKYMDIGDPTEYQVALRLFGSWGHWEALCKSKWFKELLTDWRNELRVRMESDRYYEMEERADRPDASGIQATKWLAERYGDKGTAKRGRPSKEERARHLARLSHETAEEDADAERLGLNLVQ
jgi:hypothetical protein